MAGVVTQRGAMAELEPDRESVDSEKVQSGDILNFLGVNMFTPVLLDFTVIICTLITGF